ncbi:MAG TPA: signal recognition particle protein [Candidatus Sumerlaeota bacterium]|nr:MAG: Signal recognition particle protein [candidate division BRC1 bacterium ADurb.BinA292]HOE95642.1 signal recognition particle protein [Candidatus Sumerlaeota bacterium]HOR27475.1 signal recognition particle protein [Candidatus Sumerlaeota bacterium]HPK03417.1 signal recognition particle protein [Candidatus Sumerlaeota bacterium]
MFDQLGEKFEGLFKKLRGETRLTEDNIQEAVREVRMALLEADVNFKVVRDFVAAVREKALGAEVLRAVRPGQQFIKIVHDELVAMMGGAAVKLQLQRGRLNRVVLLGLQGSGKTTFAGKLALRLKKEGFSPLLVACDIYRPAAVDQLRVVGATVDVPVFDLGTSQPAPVVAERGLAEAKNRNCDLVIFDTAGRLHIDEVRMDELQRIKELTKPDYAFLVADAMTGQDAVNSAAQFDEQVGIDGVCLTKLDGDARGGAALSIRSVTGKPIYFVGLGEKPDDLEIFHPDRMASRILGMGDVLTLVEKAQQDFDADEAERMQKKLKKEQFSLQDFLDQMQKVKKMGSLKSLMGMIPGLGSALRDVEIDDDMLKPFEAMIHSMTPEERENPQIIDGSRRKRIARGSGRTPAELNQMLQEFQGMRRMMSQMMNMGGPGGLMRGMLGGGAPAMAGARRGGALNQKSADDPLARKMKPKHRRKRKTKKKK